MLVEQTFSKVKNIAELKVWMTCSPTYEIILYIMYLLIMSTTHHLTVNFLSIGTHKYMICLTQIM